MGVYWSLVGKQGKALQCWKEAIQEGERLGAGPDLSRTYFEVGKLLLDSKSKYKELNGIDGKSYLEKARVIFKEMNLEKEMEELDMIGS